MTLLDVAGHLLDDEPEWYALRSHHDANNVSVSARVTRGVLDARRVSGSQTLERMQHTFERVFERDNHSLDVYYSCIDTKSYLFINTTKTHVHLIFPFLFHYIRYLVEH